ncbi:Protein translocase subunit SecD [Methylocella tundrae]|uniref:Protein translocase subunit SecD n=1 Tax=Methylocella tundrae TaxID=227605 RepID=A0A8B6M7K8_METTU|nr:protein translocase subunit SecD [Methylocella tundrae]VTZ25448.1 Protein translocase subunit SecD [Methylocella tundrae]VTZ50399.1 Protein translocase subunit SecD [Methylocella tundrae]
MLRFATWKIVSILAMTAFAILVIVPSLLAPDTRAALISHLPKWVPARAIVLGLDLQGGSHVLLEVDSSSVVKTMVENLRDSVRRVLRDEKVSISGGIGVLPRGVQVRIPDPAEREKVMPKLRQLTTPASAGLTTGPGASVFDITQNSDGLVQFTVTDAGIKAKVRRAVEQSIEVLRRRVDALGTTEPNIQRQGDDRVLVEVPGLQDTSKLKDILGTTAKLEFRLVGEPGADPSETEMLDEVDRPGSKLPVEKRVMVQGEDLTDAQPGFDSRTQEPVVNFRFNIRGGQRFGEVTSENVGRPFAIVLDGKVISAPRILGPITGGSGQISGHFTVESANNLAILLRAGALPAKLTIVEERTVGPGLGQDSIDAGKRAAYVGAGLVAFYMLITYGVFGVFANIALLVHIAFIFAGLVLLGATLTLPGIAGIVLTIGMAVDSNVLIYERIREEAHMGRSIVSALDAGFNRAFATIVDSNVTMFVAAAILYFLGSGPVRGFAVSLALGILTTIVTAVTMTRMMITLWYRYKRPVRLPI